MALDKLGADHINNLDDDTDTDAGAIKCRVHFEQTRDALLRSYWWPFASDRKTLSRLVATPDFEYAFQYELPTDYLDMKGIWEGGVTNYNFDAYDIEGSLLLTDENEMKIKYIKKVTDPTKFDPLFTEVFVLRLAMKLISLAGANPKMTETVGKELIEVELEARAVAGQEGNTDGRGKSQTWNDAMHGSGFPMRY